MSDKFIYTDGEFNIWEFPAENYQIITTDMLANNYPCPVTFTTNIEYKKFQKYMPFLTHFDYIHGNSSGSVCIYPNDKYLKDNIYDLAENTVILPFPIMENMEDSFSKEHDIKDLKLCEKIIDEKYPEYSQPYGQINGYYPFGIFTMNKNDLDTYYGFIYNIVKKFMDLNGLSNDFEIDIYIKGKQNGIGDQSCLFTCLMEKLTTIFYMTYFKNHNVIHKDIISIK